MKKLQLILVPELSICDIADFETIAGHICKSAPDIQVHIVKRSQLWWRQFAYLFQPALYVAFYEAKKFKPLRGLCLHGSSMRKSAQYIRMQDAGFNVIPWKHIVRGEKYTEDEWGMAAIIKPDYGREGRGVHLSKPENVLHEQLPEDGESYLIQKFVETGDNPNYFRALTLFGETLYLRKTTNGTSLTSEIASGQLPDPVANAGHGSAELVTDLEVMQFAKKMADMAFPEIPLLGQDIVRDRNSGRLYCLEVNPYGSTWHFSTLTGRKLQQRENLDYKTQFDAFKLAANVLMEKARLLAR